jgi:hypothetical protein
MGIFGRFFRVFSLDKTHNNLSSLPEDNGESRVNELTFSLNPW